MISRRNLLAALAAGAALPIRGQQPQERKGQPLDLADFQPKSMLRVPSTRVEKAKFPVIDMHSHLSWAAKSLRGVAMTGDRRYLAKPEELLQVMDRKNVRAMVNLTGGYEAGLKDAIAKYDQKYPGRFYTFTEPAWAYLNQPNYPQKQAQMSDAKAAGARGVKVLKTLGLYLRQNLTNGELVKVDDKRFDPMWDVCGQLSLPVGIHTSDPTAFFKPIDRYNERFEELNNHPDWSFHGPAFPSNEELLAARNRVVKRHPKTQFIGLHVGNFAEDLGNVAEALDQYPNFHVEISARVGELGRQPRTSRKFFDRYQDRIMFGTDAVPQGFETPQQIFGEPLYEIYYRFLETEDEYFDYAPAPTPPQGRWQIYGIGLPDSTLRKVYYENAVRLLGIRM